MLSRISRLVVAAALLLGSITATAIAPKHEMRGLWVATVYGIDWPSRVGSTAADAAAQKKELIALLDMARESGFNSIMLQVRPMGDAFYRSSLEPWSAYLTGARGQAPVTGWDPLKFAVEESHKRGLELHAWVNPFRFSASGLPDTSTDRKVISKGWILTNKKTVKTPTRKKVVKGRKGRKRTITVPGKTTVVNGVSIFDPGNPDARAHVVEVCREIVRNYDIDGLIFDDYFYPDKFPVADGLDPEEEGNRRRDNVAVAIREIYEMIQSEKPYVRFGVSPAGVAGGNGKATVPYDGLEPPAVGEDWMYEDIYCDPLRWLADGTVDYVSPQIYWPRDHATNPFEPIASWWAGVARYFKRDMYVSQSVSSLPAGSDAWLEQRAEVNATRSDSRREHTVPGQIFYSAAHFNGKKASGLGAELATHEYRTPALLPAMTWKEAPAQQQARDLVRKNNTLSWYSPQDGRWVCYAIPRDVTPIDALDPASNGFSPEYIMGVSYENHFDIPLRFLKNYWYAVAPYDRYGNEGEPITIGAPKF